MVDMSSCARRWISAYSCCSRPCTIEAWSEPCDGAVLTPATAAVQLWIISGQAILLRDVEGESFGRAHLHGGVLVRWLSNWQAGHHAAQACGEAPCEAVRLMVRDSGSVAAMKRGLRNAKRRLAALAVGLGAAQLLIRHGRSNAAAKAQRQTLRSKLTCVDNMGALEISAVCFACRIAQQKESALSGCAVCRVSRQQRCQLHSAVKPAEHPEERDTQFKKGLGTSSESIDHRHHDPPSFDGHHLAREPLLVSRVDAVKTKCSPTLTI